MDADAKSAIIEAWRSAKYPIVFTGAGISTESGLPDFRSVRGLWRMNPESLATMDALEKTPNDFYFFYQWRIAQLWDSKPNEGHLDLAKLEKAGLVKSIITQNVDGLHQMAGSKSVFELHGTLRTVRCIKCHSVMDSRTLLPNSLLSEEQYKSGLYHYGEECSCRLCEGKLRPNVVLFGEELPEQTWKDAMGACEMTDFMVSIGSSLAVSPANMCPQIAKNAGAKLLLINNDPTPLDKQANWVVSQNAGTLLNEIARELLK